MAPCFHRSRGRGSSGRLAGDHRRETPGIRRQTVDWRGPRAPGARLGPIRHAARPIRSSSRKMDSHPVASGGSRGEPMGQRPAGEPVEFLGVEEGPGGTERRFTQRSHSVSKQVGSLKVVLPTSLVQGFSKRGSAAGEGDRRDEPKGNVMLGRIGDDRYEFIRHRAATCNGCSLRVPRKTSHSTAASPPRRDGGEDCDSDSPGPKAEGPERSIFRPCPGPRPSTLGG